MPLITAPIQTTSMGTNILSPVINPQDARTQSGSLAASVSFNAGQLLRRQADGLAPYVLSAGTGTNAAVGIAMYTMQSDAAGNAYIGGSTNGTIINLPLKEAPYFTAGDFDTTQLYTYDSTSRGNLGGVVLAGATTNWVHIP